MKSERKPKMITVYKCCRSDGTDFCTGTVNYAAALEQGECVEILDAAPATGNVCGHGLHVSETARKTIQFADRSYRPWRWFEGEVAREDVIEKDTEKMRVRRFWPKKELFLADIFGQDLAARIDRVKDEITTWKNIPWLKPARQVTEKEVAVLIDRWRKAIKPWLRNKKYKLPIAVKIARSAATYADAVADAAADATSTAAATAATSTAAATAAATDATIAAYAKWNYWLRCYVRPYYVLRRYARWRLAGMAEANPWEPLVELYRLGCLPIGYSEGAFVVYVPEIKE